MKQLNWATLGCGVIANELAHALSKEGNELISLIVKKLLKYDEERNSFIERYKKYSLVLGKDIKYTKNNTEFYGTALDIDKDGGLIVKSGNSTTVLKSGEISLYL